jgi:hypothetical protein
MNNKRGGVGAKILLVLILMLASAAAGAYGYSILDGKLLPAKRRRTSRWSGSLTMTLKRQLLLKVL